MLTFNALLEAAVKLDASRWMQQAWLARAAQHCEQRDFQKFVKGTWGKNSMADEPKENKSDIGSLMRNFGRGI